MQLGERLRPVHNLGRGRLGSGEGDMVGLLHDFLLSGETSAVGSRTNSVSHLKVKIVKRFSRVLKQAIVQLIKCNCSERCSWPGHPKPKGRHTRRPHSMGSVTEPLAYPLQEITSITSDMGLYLIRTPLSEPIQRQH